MKYLIKLAIFLCPLMGIAAMPQGTTGAHSASRKAAPDLNLLRARVEAFWKLRQQGRKQEAINYVAPSCRKNFESRQEPRFMSFSLVEMRFAPDPGIVTVIVTAHMQFPQFPSPVDFPVEEQYVFRNGTWYAQIQPAVNIFESSGKKKPATPASSEMMEKMKKELNQVETKPDQIQLGELRQGSVKAFSVDYKNSGTLPALIRIAKAPEELSVNTLLAGVEPGQSGTLSFTLNTARLEGKLSDKIVLLISNREAEISREIPMEAYVKAPLTFTPPRLILGPDSRCEVTIKNQTQQEIKIRRLNSPDFVTMDGSPQTAIAPGATITVVVLWDKAKIPPTWPGSGIVFEFEKSVDGWESSFLPVLPEKPR
jgi:hypothetical protein